jgi:hypothetical protein
VFFKTGRLQSSQIKTNLVFYAGGPRAVAIPIDLASGFRLSSLQPVTRPGYAE